MKEIKFRAWRKRVMNGGYSLEWLLEAASKEPFASGIEDIVWMQYTGLKDKNGKEIYEGDIVEWVHLSQGKIQSEVKHQRGSFCHFPNWSGASWSALNRIDNSCEVIGNIYENPKNTGDYLEPERTFGTKEDY